MSNMKEFIKPNIFKILVTVFLALLGTCISVYLYFISSCWSGGNTCAGYSFIGVAGSYVLGWPILLLQKFIVGSYENFDPVIFKKFGWLAMLAYYYILV